MAYVQLTLSSNKLFVYIKTEKIIEFYADTDKDGLPCTKIITDDGDYTSVTESLSQVFSAITETENAEVSEQAESIRTGILEDAAHKLRNYCKDTLYCEDCIFRDSEGDYVCKLHHEPHRWEI